MQAISPRSQSNNSPVSYTHLDVYKRQHVLNSLMAAHGGFNHNTQSYRIVTELEHRYPDFPGLNLTYETREGMLKHETDYDVSEAANFEPDKRASLEAQIANLADEIAYNAHDLDDGLRAGLFTLDDLEAVSYTHLDVYKRQARARRRRPRHPRLRRARQAGRRARRGSRALAGACLLYTSRCV